MVFSLGVSGKVYQCNAYRHQAAFIAGKRLESTKLHFSRMGSGGLTRQPGQDGSLVAGAQATFGGELVVLLAHLRQAASGCFQRGEVLGANSRRIDDTLMKALTDRFGLSMLGRSGISCDDNWPRTKRCHALVAPTTFCVPKELSQGG